MMRNKLECVDCKNPRLPGGNLCEDCAGPQDCDKCGAQYSLKAYVVCPFCGDPNINEDDWRLDR